MQIKLNKLDDCDGGKSFKCKTEEINPANFITPNFKYFLNKAAVSDKKAVFHRF